ncbi:MAG TPA: hypothetical protein DEB40_12315 [Elusimicrobia bacterium]|nr:hypothetical protein [Elusimicrobiota bacterium]HBT62518.1 hypothetical protein [Elusimicrobiota bacterium]
MTLCALFVVCAGLLGAQSDFFIVPEQDQGSVVIQGLPVSLGSGRRVTGRLTYDREQVAAGGRVYAPRTAEAASAGRMAEALILASGSRLSPTAAWARSRRVAAVVLDSARWENGVLSVEQTVFGKTVKDPSGIAYQVAENHVWVRLKEGDVVTLDPVQGSVVLSAAENAESDLAAAEALRAYDGLRDGQALVQWWQARLDQPRAGIILVAELAERLAVGAARADDFALARRAVESSLAPDAKKLLRARERRAFYEQSRLAESFLRESLRSTSEAATAMAVRRVSIEAEARWRGLKELAEALGLAESRPVAALWHRLKGAAADRCRGLPERGAGDGFAAVAAAAGAALPRRGVLGMELYQRFLDEKGLGPRIAEIADDASLGLRRKSLRIRSLIMDSALTPESGLGRQILERIPEADRYSVSGAHETFSDVSRADVLKRILESWAACWDPGPLGARKRAASNGLAAAPSAEVTVTASVPAEIVGTICSRDPSSGSRERLVVSASKPGSSTGEYLLDRKTGRALSSVMGTDERLLPTEVLAKLARAARGLDSHNGRGQEITFVWDSGKLYLLGSRPMAGDEEPARAAPFAVTPPVSADVPVPDVNFKNFFNRLK